MEKRFALVAALLLFTITFAGIVEAANLIVYNNSAPTQTPYFVVNGTTGYAGIGTANPSQALHVVGNVFASNLFLSPSGYRSSNTNAGFFVDSPASNDLKMQTNAGNVLVLKDAGNVGIGTTTPSQKLDVRGIGNFSGTIYVNNNTDIVGLINGINSSGTAADDWNLSGSNLFPKALNYFVGIGTTSPSATFQVNGNATYLNSRLVTQYPDYDNLFPNGNFETIEGSSFVGWAGANNFSTSTAVTHNGLYSMEGTGDAAVRDRTSYLKIPYTKGSGERIVLEFWYNTSSDFSGQAGIWIQSFNRSNVANSDWTGCYVSAAQTTWAKKVCTLSFDGSTKDVQYLQVGLTMRETVPAGAKFYWDDIKIYRMQGNSTPFYAGIYYDADNPLYYLNLSATGNSLVTQGKIGVGTTTPSQMLDVRGIGNFSGTVYVNNNTDIIGLINGINASGSAADDWNLSGSNIFPKDLSYNVGVGIAAPTAKLYVNQSANAQGLYVEGGAAGFELAHFARRNGATADINITAHSGEPQIIFGTGGVSRYVAGYDTVGGFSISEGNELATGTSRIYIKETSGNVGIGTINPGATLDVQGSTLLNRTTLRQPTAGATQLVFQNHTGNSAWEISATGIDLMLYSYAQASAPLYLRGNGNVGIGTSTPSQKLDVRGIGNFSGTVYINNGTDLSAFVSGNGTGTYVPYSGANNNVNIGVYNLTTTGIVSASNLRETAWDFEGTLQGASIWNNNAYSLAGASWFYNDTEKALEGYKAASYIGGAEYRFGYPIDSSVYNKFRIRAKNVLGTIYVQFRYANGSTDGTWQISGWNPTTFAEIEVTIPAGNVTGVYINTNSGVAGAEIYIQWMKIYRAIGVGSSIDSVQTGDYLPAAGGFTGLQGNVGIGTTTPSQKLDVGGNIKVQGIGNFSGVVYVNNGTEILSYINTNIAGNSSGSGTNTTTTFVPYVGASKSVNLGANNLTLTTGKVGIGTNNPNVSLDIYVSGGIVPTNATTITHLTNGGDGGPILNFRVEDGSTAVDGAETLGRISGWGSYAANSYVEGARIDLKPESGYNATSAPSYITLSTSTLNSVTPSERVRINSQGFVGIGNTNPQNRLSITNAAGFDPSANTNSSIFLSGSYGGGIIFSDTAYSGIWAKSSGQELHFSAGGSATKVSNDASQNGAFIVKASDVIVRNGSLGIGTTTPSRALDVRGIGNFSGTVYLNNNTDILALVNSINTSSGTNGTATYVPYLGANKNIGIGNNYLSNDGGNEGIRIESDGDVFFGNISGGQVFVSATNGQGTSNGDSFYQWDGNTYRNPGTHNPELIIRADNPLNGTMDFRPGLVIYNNAGNMSATAGLTFASREEPLAGNSVALGSIFGVKETPGTANSWASGGLQFVTKNQGTGVHALRITAAGNVGIGTTSPSAALEVNNTAPSIYLTASQDSTYRTVIENKYFSANPFNINVLGYNLLNSTDSGYSLALNTRNPNGALFLRTAGTNRLTINGTTGNVGIGTTTPSQALDVRGIGNFSGTVYLNNNTDVLAYINTNIAGNSSGGSTNTSATFVPYVGASKNLILGNNNLTIGAGRTTPLATLDVNGSLAAVTYLANGTYYLGKNSFILGSVSSNGSITSSGVGSFAQGYANYNGNIFSSGSASFAQGYADSRANITSSYAGSFAQGYAEINGNIVSSYAGSFAQGYASAGSITSSGVGSFAQGYASAGSITSSGNGAVALGDNLTASNTLSFAFGKGFTNNLANTFQVGFSTTPTLFINGTAAGINTIEPKAKLHVQGDVILNASATGGNVVIQL